MTFYFVLLLLMTFLGAIAALFLKKASANDGLWKIFTDLNLYIGGFLYLTSAVLNIIILKYLDYSLVLPLTSLTYVWTMIISYLFLREQITKRKFCGIVMIILGAACISF